MEDYVCMDTPVEVGGFTGGGVGGYTGGDWWIHPWSCRWMSVEIGGTLADSVDSVKMLVEAGGEAGRVDGDYMTHVGIRA